MKLLKKEIRIRLDEQLEEQIIQSYANVHYEVWEKVYDPLWIELNQNLVYLMQEILDEIS